MSNSRTFWFFTISVGALLILPLLVKQSMFLDGITYASISRNLSMGSGSWLKPHYTQTLYPAFFEHPPLVFQIQSIFFTIFGDTLWTERIYTLFTTILTGFGIHILWQLTSPKPFRSFSWLPVLVWITVPIIFWSYRNNMLENTVSIFVLFAVFFIVKSSFSRRWLYLALGALMVLFAVLSKGPVGLFPLVTPIVYQLTTKKTSFLQSLVSTGVLISFLLTGFILLFQIFPGSLENISHYLDQQLLPALKNEREIKTNNHFYIVQGLFLEILIPLLLTLFVFLKNRLRNSVPISIPKRISFFYLVMGLSASIPLMITLKQSRAYLVPSIPFFAIAFAFGLIPYLSRSLVHIPQKTGKIFKWVVYGLMFVSIVLTLLQTNTYGKDEPLVKDVQKIMQIIPEGSVISGPDLCENWSLVAYLNRYASISLDCQHGHIYLLTPIGIPQKTIKPGYKNMNIELNEFAIYQKQLLGGEIQFKPK
jgi:4-amino-4-deoxy-L-arabinose transferase-like glycosyltransferase